MPDATTIMLIVLLLVVLTAAFLGSGSDHPH